MESNSNSSPLPLIERCQLASTRVQAAIASVETVFIGQTEVVKLMFATLLAGGHVSFEGDPSVGKTTVSRAFAEVLGLSFQRIQGRSDLMPNDIVGSLMLDLKTNEFKAKLGPIFANIVLFDEGNRASPKAQGALLEAMQENQVTIDTETYKLPWPFMLLMTQNPIESEGVYPLTQANEDRLMTRIYVDYPDRETEIRIALETEDNKTLSPIFNGEAEIIALQKLVKEFPIGQDFAGICVDVVRTFRPRASDVPDFIKEDVASSASLRASKAMVRMTKSLALLEGRMQPDKSDIRRVAGAILNHRVKMKGYGEDDSFARTLDKVLRNFQIA